MINIVNYIISIAGSIYFKIAVIILILYIASRIVYRLNRNISIEFIKDLEPFFKEGIKILQNDQTKDLEIEFRFNGGEGVFTCRRDEKTLKLKLYNSLFCHILIIPEEFYEILNMASPFPTEIHLFETITNDADFDREYKIKIDDPDKAKKLLTAEIMMCIRKIHAEKKDFMTIVMSESEIIIDRDISIHDKNNLKLFLINSKELGETFANNIRKQI